MRYYSTNNPNTPVGLCDAILRSIAPDGGVYMPLSIPLIPPALFKNIADMSLTDIGYIVANSILGPDIPAATINDIVKETLNFPIPLRQFGEHTYALELFHGPTGTFKDIGARFMAKVVEHILKSGCSNTKNVNVFVATLGDTGIAVANGFAGIEGVNVYILQPKGQSPRGSNGASMPQAPNIRPISIRGSFDDCQRLVKEIYTDTELNRKLTITSANSINIARLLPQTFFYFHAYARLHEMEEKPGRLTMSCPCGNLGNLTAALFSRQLGLPLERILASGLNNERLWGEIQSGQLAVNTFNSRALSNNLSRINALIKANPTVANLIECYTYTDTDVADQIKQIYNRNEYLMDRNTAMACRALEQNLHSGETGIFLATASPAKYADRLHEILGPNIRLDIPSQAKDSQPRAETITLPPLLPAIKRYLLDQN